MSDPFGAHDPEAHPPQLAAPASVQPAPAPRVAADAPPANGSITFRYVILSGGNLTAALIGFLGTLAVARQFGPAGLGATTLALSLVGYAITVTVFGTNLHAVRLVAARPEKLEQTIAGVIMVRLIAGSGAYAALIALMLLAPSLSDVALLAAIFGLSVFSTAVGPEWAPQAMHRTDITAVANLGTQVLYVAFLGVVWLTGTGLWSVAAAKLGADALVAAGVLHWARGRRIDQAVSLPTRVAVREIAAAAAPMCLAQLAQTTALGSDLVLLGFFVTRDQLGYYAAASRIFMVLLSLATAYFIILFPRLAERAAQPGTALRDELGSSLRRTVPLALAGAAGLAVLGAPLLSLVFGPGFIAGSVPLALLAGAAVANLGSRHYRQVLLVRRRQIVDLRITGAGAVVHVAAKLALIPVLGIAGAAAGTLIGEGFMLAAERRAAQVELDPRARN